ncbi:MAG: hypothetical protein WC969_08335 [Elusimicrobiota bacterium]
MTLRLTLAFLMLLLPPLTRGAGGLDGYSDDQLHDLLNENADLISQNRDMPKAERESRLARVKDCLAELKARAGEEDGGGETPPGKPPAHPGEAAKVATLFPDSVEAQVTAAQEAAHSQDPQSAAPYIQRALALDPNNPQANKLAAQKALAEGDNAAAAKHANAALKSDPNDAKALSLSALAKNAAGDKAGALADAKRALGADPKDKTALALANLLDPRGVAKGVGNIKAPDFGRTREPGALPGGAAERGRPPGAKPSPERGPAAPPPREAVPARDPGPPIGRSAPEKAAFFLNDALTRLGMKDYAGAASAAGMAIENGAPGAGPYVLRGKANEAMGKHEEAVKDETAALEKELDASLEALVQRAWAQIGREETGEAQKDAASALKMNPGSERARAVQERANATPGRGAPADASATDLPALPAYTGGIGADSIAFTRRAQAKLAVGDASAALKLADLALQADQKNYLAYIVRAAAHRLDGRFDLAVKDSTRALWLQPLATEALLTRSLAHLQLKEWKQAEEDASAAIRLDPNRAEAYKQRALARRELGDLNGMKEDFARAAELEKGPPPERSLWGSRLLRVALGFGGALLAFGVLSLLLKLKT